MTGEVTFRVDPDAHCTPLRVWFHLRDYGADPTFHLENDQWVARIPRPPVDRLEYLLVLGWPDGGESMVIDPANPHRVRAVFGDKSVLELPGYARPWWLSVADELVPLALPATLLDETPDPTDQASGEGLSSVPVHAAHRRRDDRIRRSPVARTHPAGALVAGAGTAEVVDPEADIAIVGQLHVPADSAPDEALPLLVVHDGPEYADLAQLLGYMTTLAQMEPHLRCRVLLLEPVDRDRTYSASPAYARALVTRMLPKVTDAVATEGQPVGVGASLGGLAMLHAASRYPGSFSGLFSQSGSFFQPRTDAMERGYRHYARIVRFVDELGADPERLAGLHLTMTCGTGEENLANNQALARRLARRGVPTTLIENPDGHNYTAWRDCLDPGLRLLLRTAWVRTGDVWTGDVWTGNARTGNAPD